MAFGALVAASPGVFQAEAPPGSALSLSACRIDGVGETLRCGIHRVFENRETRQGRTLPLKIVVIPARRAQSGSVPVFALLGGPGETATEAAAYMIENGVNEENDVVLI